MATDTQGWNLDQTAPFSSGVIELQKADLQRAETETEFGPSIFDLLRQCGPNTRDIIKRAIRIARNQNHNPVEMCHVLLAMTLTPAGAGQLAVNSVDQKAVRDACWEELKNIDPLPDVSTEVVFSNELTDVIQHATASAARRGEDQFVIHVADILYAIINPPLDQKFARYRRLVTDPAKETLQAATDIKSMVQQLSWETKAKLDYLSSEIRSNLDQLSARSDKRLTRLKYLSNAVLGIASVVLALVLALLMSSLFR